MLRFVAFGLVGCYTSSAPVPRAREPVPEVRFAIADGADVRIVRTSESGLVVERTVATPAVISHLVYGGTQLAVWLDARSPGGMRGTFDEPDETPHPHENEMGLVTEAGYQKLAPVAWPAVPKEAVTEFADMATEHDETTLIATDSELWQGHCAWYGGPDGGWCLHWTYARRSPSPIAFADKAPALPRSLALPKLAAPSAVRVEIRDLPKGEDRPEWAPAQRVLACSSGNATMAYPPEDKRDHERPFEVTWLSQEPPIFLVKSFPEWAGVGRGPDPVYRVFEGCTLSRRFEKAFAGPRDIVVIAGDELSVRWRGREIGRLARGGSAVAFPR